MGRVGRIRRDQIDIKTPALVMPENYHGEISYSFDSNRPPISMVLLPQYLTVSETDKITMTGPAEGGRPGRPEDLIGTTHTATRSTPRARSGSTRTPGAWSTFPGSRPSSGSSRPS